VQPLAEFARAERPALRGVFCDVDDTLTTDGRLTADAYGALERLEQAGLLVIPITGRPAGWCDHMARFWPVHAVVGENGAFYFQYDRTARTMHRAFVDDAATRAAHRARLDAVREEILAAVPGSQIAADQQYRETDLAIDYCEDVEALPRTSVERIAAIMARHGMTAKISSIHVNGWFGRYDKLTMICRLMRERFNIDLDAARERYLFIGDSPNDAPLFGYFPHSVGVANIRDFEDRLTHAPRYVTLARGGAGFCELADVLI
jgi:HAD superfamily hydrolase (TIGR01484 family)